MNDTLFPDVGIATVHVLERLGHEVEFPEAQTCCGQLHLNSGYQDAARDLARHFVGVFADREVVVAPSASCVATVREFYPYLAEQFDDAWLAAQVEAIVPRVMELTEFLVRRLGVTDVGARFAPAARRAPGPSSHMPGQPVPGELAAQARARRDQLALRVRTGHVACRSVRSATLPSTTCFRPVSPRVPITIRSAWISCA